MMLGSMGIAAAALFYAAIGVSALIRPHNLLQDFNLLAETAAARNEVRGIYGGFPLAVAGLLVFCLSGSSLADGILFALGFCTLGMALGRIVCAVIDQKLDRHPALWMVLELIVAVVIFAGIDGA